MMMKQTKLYTFIIDTSIRIFLSDHKLLDFFFG